MHARMHAHAGAHMQACRHARTHACRHARTHACTCAHGQDMKRQLMACLYTYLYTDLYACLHTGLYACLYTCVWFVPACALTHICRHVHTHVYTQAQDAKWELVSWVLDELLSLQPTPQLEARRLTPMRCNDSCNKHELGPCTRGMLSSKELYRDSILVSDMSIHDVDVVLM